jgi:hypothetical protein
MLPTITPGYANLRDTKTSKTQSKDSSSTNLDLFALDTLPFNGCSTNEREGSHNC